jgi:glycolate oxidase subunit GlcD
MNAIATDLSRLLGADTVLNGSAQEPYLRDSTEMQGLVGLADAVVLPSSVDDIQAVVTWCYERGVSIIPRGGGTGFSGGAVPIDGGVVCSLERLNRVIAFQPELWQVYLEAGVTTARVHQMALKSGLLFPPNPGASEQSQIGGNLACNAGGPRSFKYGVTGTWVTGLEAVVSAGQRVRFGGPIRKDVAGYDLKSLFIGSEGTLGIVVSAWLRLIPAPEASRSVVASFSDLAHGYEAVQRILSMGLQPTTIEYFDSGCIGATRATFPKDLPDRTHFLIVSECDGTISEADRLANDVSDAVGENALSVSIASSRHDLSQLTRWRNGISFAVSAKLGGKMSEDISVPLDSLADGIEKVNEIGRRFNLEACSWGHAGDGNLHATFMLDASSAAARAAADGAARAVFDWTLSVGGSVSGEHGLGWVKRGEFDRQFGPTEARLQRGLKNLFDPQGLFNPNKKVPQVRVDYPLNRLTDKSDNLRGPATSADLEANS